MLRNQRIENRKHKEMNEGIAQSKHISPRKLPAVAETRMTKLHE